jgi:hypothetical protein
MKGQLLDSPMYKNISILFSHLTDSLATYNNIGYK